MRTLGHSLRRGSVLFAMLSVVAACDDHGPITSPSRSFSPSASFSRAATPITGRHIFVMNGAVPSDFVDRVEAKGGHVLAIHDQIQVAVTNGLSDVDASSLAGDGSVVTDVMAQWAPTPQQLHTSFSNAAVAGDVLPQARSPFQAALLASQWNMFQIHAPEAWQTKTGSPSVKVAILDSGLDPFHPELQGLIITKQSRSYVGSGGVDKCNFNSNWVDDFFHGTYVGGLVTTNNIVIAGVAPNVRLVAVKVLNSQGAGSFADLICGAMYAASIHAQVINMSLGFTFIGVDKKVGEVLQTVLTRYFELVREQGSLAVSAAGNEGKNLGGQGSSISLPCEAGPQLCVSATSASDVLASYSNFGRGQADVLAPGGDAKQLGQTPTNDDLLAQLVIGLCSSQALNCYTVDPVTHRLVWHPFILADGTSGAAPHVSGLAALLDSQYGGALSPDDLASRIVANTESLGNLTRYGQGRINVARTLGVTVGTP